MAGVECHGSKCNVVRPAACFGLHEVSCYGLQTLKKTAFKDSSHCKARSAMLQKNCLAMTGFPR